MNKIYIYLKKLKDKGFFHILFGGTFTKIVAFISSIVIVRLVSKDDYAVLAYADNIYSYVILFSGMGMASAVLKYCVNDDKGKNKAFYNFAFKYGTIFQIILLAITVLYVCLANFPFSGIRKLLLLLLPYGFLYYWVQLFQSFLRTTFQNREYALSSFVQVLLTFVLSVLFVLIIEINGVAIARIAAMVVSIAIFSRVLKDYRANVSEKVELTKNEIKEFLVMALTLLASNVFSMIMPNNEAYLINNIIKDNIITANYKVANLIPSQLPFITSTLVIYFFPLVSKMKCNIDTWKYVKKVGLIAFIINFIVSLIGCVLSPLIIQIVYGNTYSDINGLMSILWWVYFINAGFRMIPLNLLPALGHVKFNLVVAIFSSIVLFALDYFLINNSGIYGAIIARAVVNCVSGVLYWLYLRKKCMEGII